MNWETLLSFGDSITFGARSYLGYPEICGDILMNKLKKKWHVINHSTNGFTTIDLVRSMNPEFETYKNCFPSVITVMIGTNDVKKKVMLNDFEIAYKQLIVKLKLLSVENNIILLKIPSFTQAVFYPYYYSMNDQVDIFNSCIEKLGNENNLRCLQLNLSNGDYFDGVHLNANGVRTVALQLASYILKDKGFEGTSTLS